MLISSRPVLLPSPLPHPGQLIYCLCLLICLLWTFRKIGVKQHRRSSLRLGFFTQDIVRCIHTTFRLFICIALSQRESTFPHACLSPRFLCHFPINPLSHYSPCLRPGRPSSTHHLGSGFLYLQMLLCLLPAT